MCVCVCLHIKKYVVEEFGYIYLQRSDSFSNYRTYFSINSICYNLFPALRFVLVVHTHVPNHKPGYCLRVESGGRGEG